MTWSQSSQGKDAWSWLFEVSWWHPMVALTILLKIGDPRVGARWPSSKGSLVQSTWEAPALLRSLLMCHSKVPLEFFHLKTKTLKLLNLLSMNKLIYQHHLLTLGDSETIKRIYEKQKSHTTPGHCYELLLKDFKFNKEDKNKEEIKSFSKLEYKKKI